MPSERSPSLYELLGPWDEPIYLSHLGRRIHELWRVPLAQFGVEDLRIVIGQKRALEQLIPLAVDRLDKEPLAEGDFYPGDLLAVVLRVEPAFWSTRVELRQRLANIVARVGAEPNLVPELANDLRAFRA